MSYALPVHLALLSIGSGQVLKAIDLDGRAGLLAQALGKLVALQYPSSSILPRLGLPSLSFAGSVTPGQRTATHSATSQGVNLDLLALDLGL